MKHVAATIQRLAFSENLQRVLNRSEPIDDLIEPTLAHWSYDLYERRPGPAYLGEDGGLKPTDLDLSCFLSALVDRGAVINLPTYESRRPKTVREGECVLSPENRHGKIVGMTANKSVFSFSVRVFDQNVVTTDTVGAFRNFMLVDLNGQWHEGWKSIEFIPSAKENSFLTDNKLWTGNSVVFKNFVHPNRWVSFFGQYYLFTKLLIQRLSEEVSFIGQEIKRLVDGGEKLPSLLQSFDEIAPVKTDDGTIEFIDAFEVEIDAPWNGEFRSNIESELMLEDLKLAHFIRKRNLLLYSYLPKLRFAVRATELAFFKRCESKFYERQTGKNLLWMTHGPTLGGFPGWISGAQWLAGYREKGKRTDWHRLVLAQTFPGIIGLAIRCRTWKKSERVAI